MRKIHYICIMKTEQEVIEQLKRLEKDYEDNRQFLKESNDATIGEIRQTHVEQNMLIAEISMLRWVLGISINESVDDKYSEK